MEALPITARTFGRGWVEIEALANEERLDPWEGVDGAGPLRAVRATRSLRALDEGRAWRQRTPGALAVLRAETFAEPDPAEHIGLWRDHGAAMLRCQWQARWRDRELHPGWVEATLDEDGPRSDTDEDDVAQVWFRVEDHTDPAGAATVTCYRHLSFWHRRHHAVLVVRHELGAEVTSVCRQAATVLADALARP